MTFIRLGSRAILSIGLTLTAVAVIDAEELRSLDIKPLDRMSLDMSASVLARDDRQDHHDLLEQLSGSERIPVLEALLEALRKEEVPPVDILIDYGKFPDGVQDRKRIKDRVLDFERRIEDLDRAKRSNLIKEMEGQAEKSSSIGDAIWWLTLKNIASDRWN